MLQERIGLKSRRKHSKTTLSRAVVVEDGGVGLCQLTSQHSTNNIVVLLLVYFYYIMPTTTVNKATIAGAKRLRNSHYFRQGQRRRLLQDTFGFRRIGATPAVLWVTLNQ